MKAAFLVIVFALHTIVGFACSIGLGMSSPTSPKRNALKAFTAAQKQKSNSKDQVGVNCHVSKKPGKGEQGAGKCCANKVREFEEIDKAVSASKSMVHPVPIVTVQPAYYHFILLACTDVTRNLKPFIRSHHPPIPDIRTAIQSFQI